MLSYHTPLVSFKLVKYRFVIKRQHTGKCYEYVFFFFLKNFYIYLKILILCSVVSVQTLKGHQ